MNILAASKMQVPLHGNFELRPLGVAMWNAVSVTRALSIHIYKNTTCWPATDYDVTVIRFRVQGRRTRKSGVTSHKRVFNQNQNKTENVNNAGVVSSSGTRLFVFLGAAHSLTAVLTIALSPFPPGLRAFSILSDNHWN